MTSQETCWVPTPTEAKLLSAIEVLDERLQTLEALMRLIVRQRMTNKEELLCDEVKRRCWMEVSQVMKHFDLSRPGALNLMRRLAKKELGFTFRSGDPALKKPSVISYDRGLVIRQQNERIEKLFSVNRTVPFILIMNEFGFVDIGKAKIVAEMFVENNKHYVIADNNKIVRCD